MTLKVIGSGEIVQQVFWLDTRTGTAGVKLLNLETGYERCSERPVADFTADGVKAKSMRASVENYLGDHANVILRDE